MPAIAEMPLSPLIVNVIMGDSLMSVLVVLNSRMDWSEVSIHTTPDSYPKSATPRCYLSIGGGQRKAGQQEGKWRELRHPEEKPCD